MVTAQPYPDHLAGRTTNFGLGKRKCVLVGDVVKCMPALRGPPYFGCGGRLNRFPPVDISARLECDERAALVGLHARVGRVRMPR